MCQVRIEAFSAIVYNIHDSILAAADLSEELLTAMVLACVPSTTTRTEIDVTSLIVARQPKGRRSMPWA